uniref:Uncharacterized protein n=1 Tax=Panagrolaimus sp. ES5 TaxID=591445 RepID=A0AC34FZR9_9BILA
MKFRCLLSIFIFLYIVFQFQLSDAIFCPQFEAIDKPIKIINSIAKFDNPKNVKIASLGAGCPNDFYDLCSIFTIAVKEVKERGPNNLDYHNDVFTVYYSSGCGSESDGQDCMWKKYRLYENKTDEELLKLKENDPEKFAAIQRKRNYIEYLLNGGTTPTSDSNNQNDAVKFIGFIIVGWIFAFWNL